jgi:adenosylcobalamin-dependent ribonucleoside-triphosphate reductase
MEIQKRNGNITKYDGTRIIWAITNAMIENNSKNIDIAEEIENEIHSELTNFEEIISVEEIQDLIEEKLMEKGEYQSAKNFILYREKSKKNRKENKYNLLSNEFLSKYKHKPNPFPTDFGEFVYYRTYSRWLPEKLRREDWWETVARAVDFNCSLIPNTTKYEAEKLYDNIYNLKQFLSGRTLWQGGTEVSKRYAMSNFNCSFVIIDNLEAYKDMFYLLMVGAGVGFRVLKDDVEKLPLIRQDIEVIHKYYNPINKENRKEFTCLNFNHNNIAEIEIGDSKEAWVESLGMFFNIISDHKYYKINTIILNYNNVRPKGERLKTFGGTASGHESIKNMFEKITKVLKNSNNIIKENKIKLKTIDCMDISNIIGENVVSGGVRRTSEVCLFEFDDKDILNAKSNLYELINGEYKLNKDIYLIDK